MPLLPRRISHRPVLVRNWMLHTSLHSEQTQLRPFCDCVATDLVALSLRPGHALPARVGPAHNGQALFLPHPAPAVPSSLGAKWSQTEPDSDGHVGPSRSGVGGTDRAVEASSGRGRRSMREERHGGKVQVARMYWQMAIYRSSNRMMRIRSRSLTVDQGVRM